MFQFSDSSESITWSQYSSFTDGKGTVFKEARTHWLCFVLPRHEKEECHLWSLQVCSHLNVVIFVTFFICYDFLSFVDGIIEAGRYVLFFSYTESLKYCFSFFWVLEFAVYCSGRSLKNEPTFLDATNGFPTKWRLRIERINSILMTCHYPDLGSASGPGCSNVG